MAGNNTGIIVASVIGGVAILGIGGYLIYKSGQSKTSTTIDPTASLLALQRQSQLGSVNQYPQNTGIYNPSQQPVIFQQPETETQTYVKAGLQIFDTLFGSKKQKSDSTVFVDDTNTTQYDTTASNDYYGYGELPAGGGVLLDSSSSYPTIDYGKLWGSSSYGV